MDEIYMFDSISEEVMAGWLDGMLSPEEEELFIGMLGSDPHAASILDANDEITEDYEYSIDNGYELPSELDLDFMIPEINEPDDPTDLINHHSQYDDGDEESDDSLPNDSSEEYFDNGHDDEAICDDINIF